MLVDRRERITTRPSWLVLPRPRRIWVNPAELSVVWLGRIVIFVSLAVVFADAAVFGYPLFSVLMNVLYAGYVVVWWPDIRTRRVEAACLALIGLGLAALYTGVPLWGGPEFGVEVTSNPSAGLPR